MQFVSAAIGLDRCIFYRVCPPFSHQKNKNLQQFAAGLCHHFIIIILPLAIFFFMLRFASRACIPGTVERRREVGG